MSLKSSVHKVGFFEFTSFASFRESNLQCINKNRVHEKYQEIRNVLSLIKDYNSNPENLSALSEKLQELETPPCTPEKNPGRFLPQSAPRSNHTHFPSMSPFIETPRKSKNEENLKMVIQKLEKNLAQNLEETKELKSMFLQSQLKLNQNSFKTSFLDMLQEPISNPSKLTDSSFGIGRNENFEYPSSSGIKQQEPKEKHLIGEISMAERKVYELQSQRFLNKIQELNKKIDGLTKEKGKIEEKLQKIESFLSRDKIFGKVECSRALNKANIETFTKEAALLELFEEFWLEVTSDGLNFSKNSDFSEVHKNFTWSQILDLSLFEKDQEPLIGFYVLKVQEKEDAEAEYWLIKTNGHSWEIRFLAIGLKVQAKNSDISHLLRKSRMTNILTNREPLNITESNFHPNVSRNSKDPKASPNAMPVRGMGSLRTRKSIKCSFHQMAHSNGNSPTLCNSPSMHKPHRNSRGTQSESSKSLQPLRNSLNVGQKSKYQSTFDLKNHPAGLTDSVLKKGILEGISQESRAKNILKNGFVFLKYGKYGEPHERLILLSNCERKIEWKAINKKTANSIEIEEIREIKDGRTSSIFMKYKAKTKEQSELSFSLCYGINKTLDLEANTKENKNKFIASLRFLMKKGLKGKGQAAHPLKRIITDQAYRRQKSGKSSAGLSLIEVEDQSEKEEKGFLD